jgi:hypothetical protein
MTADCQKAADAITLHRDPQTDEWVFDLSPGLDLLEVARVLSVVQQHALQLLQQQLQDSPKAPYDLPNAAGGSSDAIGNQFAQR